MRSNRANNDAFAVSAVGHQDANPLAYVWHRCRLFANVCWMCLVPLMWARTALAVASRALVAAASHSSSLSSSMLSSSLPMLSPLLPPLVVPPPMVLVLPRCCPCCCGRRCGASCCAGGAALANRRPSVCHVCHWRGGFRGHAAAAVACSVPRLLSLQARHRGVGCAMGRPVSKFSCAVEPHVPTPTCWCAMPVTAKATRAVPQLRLWRCKKSAKGFDEVRCCARGHRPRWPACCGR